MLGRFTSATGVVVAACTSWLTLLSHPSTVKSRKQPGLKSLSEGVTGKQQNGHDDSERREITVKKVSTGDTANF